MEGYLKYTINQFLDSREFLLIFKFLGSIQYKSLKNKMMHRLELYGETVEII